MRGNAECDNLHLRKILERQSVNVLARATTNHFKVLCRIWLSVQTFQGPITCRVTYEVPVANLQCFVNTIANFTRGSLPGTVSQLTMLHASRKLFAVDRMEKTYGIL